MSGSDYPYPIRQFTEIFGHYIEDLSLVNSNIEFCSSSSSISYLVSRIS